MTPPINQSLRRYISTHIFPQYSQNDAGHQLPHIQYVIRRSLHFATLAEREFPKLNYDITYAAAAFHDLGHHIDAEHHEIISANLALADSFLRHFFSASELSLVAQAIREHRSRSNSPNRDIYNKILISADCNINIDAMIRRTYAYRFEHHPELDLAQIIADSFRHLSEKYGPNGYAIHNNYFPDPEFDAALRELHTLLESPEAFDNRYRAVLSCKS